MGEAPDNPQSKLWFPNRLRELRLAKKLKQREVADGIHVKLSSYGNAESSNYKRIRLDRVMRIARFYELDQAATAELIAGWEALPESSYNKNMAKPWAQRAARRSKLRTFDKMKLALLEVTTMWVCDSADPDSLCACVKADPGELFPESGDQSGTTCELCNALQLVGLTGWLGREETVAQLAKIQESLGG